MISCSTSSNNCLISFAKINLAFFQWNILKCIYLILQRMTLTAFQENATATLWRTFGAIPIQQCGMPQLFCDAIWPPRRLEFLPVLHAELQHIKLKTSLYLFRPDSIINQGKKNNQWLACRGPEFLSFANILFLFLFFFLSAGTTKCIGILKKPKAIIGWLIC